MRILGRDISRVGKVEYTDEKAKTPLAASTHLKALLPMASDPDAGVRRELILALRDLPSERGRRGDQDPRPDLGRPGSLVSGSPRPGARRPRRRVRRRTLRRDALRRPGPRRGRAGGQGRAAAVLPGRSERGVHRRGREAAAGQRPDQDAGAGLAGASAGGPAAAGPHPAAPGDARPPAGGRRRGHADGATPARPSPWPTWP